MTYAAAVPTSVACRVVTIAPKEWRLCEQVDVAREDLQRERRRIDALAAALAALVHVEQAELVAERIEPRPEHRVVHARAAVEDDEREALADFLDEHPVPVGESHIHVA